MRAGNVWHRVWRRLPPDRDIIVRTGDRVGYLRLPRWLQLGAVGIVGLVVAWIALATHFNLNQLEIIAHRDARIAAAEDARHTVERELADAQKQIARMQRRIDVGRERAERLVAANREQATKIDTLQGQIARDDVAHSEDVARQDTLRDEIAGLQRRIDALGSDRSRIADGAEALRRELARRERDKQALTARIARLEPKIASLEAARAAHGEELASVRDELARRVAERDRVASERDRLATERDLIADRFAALSNQLASLESAQEKIIDRFDSQTVDSIELVEKTLALTGVDVDRLLGRVTPALAEDGGTGVGGPFVAALDDAGISATSELANNIAAVEGRVVRWQGLQTLLARMPLTAPLDSFHVTSTFGRRLDPMRGRPAMHEGIDFSSEHRAEVRSTAPGRVSFVGWRGGYGKMIEVDHGLGIRTRYAHLSKMYVKRGQQVDFRDKLGQIGNTGRSTGEHLHYEVVLDGRALDPANFMKAGQYVFKN